MACEKHPGRFHDIYDCQEQRLIECVICELERMREERMRTERSALRRLVDTMMAILDELTKETNR